MHQLSVYATFVTVETHQSTAHSLIYLTEEVSYMVYSAPARVFTEQLLQQCLHLRVQIGFNKRSGA